MKKSLLGVLMACVLGGCAVVPVAPVLAPVEKVLPVAADDPAKPVVSPMMAVAPDEPSRSPAGPWVGAAGASDFVMAGVSETVLGVWIDVPTGAQKKHAPAAVALVIDVSGSMAGAKIDNARSAAHALVEKLADGDIVSIHSFSDEARERVAPTQLDRGSRAAIYRVIDSLDAAGGTNLFDGLRLGESRSFNAPATHPVRRVVVISDGAANIGPSTPEILGELASRGAENGIQVTAVGVGIDYDEHTLNALAMRSSGRLYHISEARELSAMLESELGLLQSTAATNAVLEVVPAPGVQILGVDGLRTEWGPNGALRFPLGTMFGGQHREMAIRVRVTAQVDGAHPLASVRFHFRDPADGNLDRVQEVVARYQVTSDHGAIEQHLNAKTQTIVTTQEASRAALAAADSLNKGSYESAEKDLAIAETKLRASAATASTVADKKRVLVAASKIADVREQNRAAAAAPRSAKPAMRAPALDLNAAAVRASGF
jgi:Ca-activated chloride channel family protein